MFNGHSTQPFLFALLMLAAFTILKFQIFNEHINKQRLPWAVSIRAQKTNYFSNFLIPIGFVWFKSELKANKSRIMASSTEIPSKHFLEKDRKNSFKSWPFTERQKCSISKVKLLCVRCMNLESLISMLNLRCQFMDNGQTLNSKYYKYPIW